MLRPAPLFVPLLATLVLGCAEDETEPPAGEPGPACQAPEVGLPDGTCIRPGVPPDGCAEGFEHDGAYGCEPVLPAGPCPPGLMAVPGDAECRPVMPCGEGTWGDLPVDGSTQYVDAAYAGSSNGSFDAPWTTVGEAVAAAAPGALVAVAAGSYPEDVIIAGKPVRLWGRCPEMVELVGTGAKLFALLIRAGASGTEVGGLAITGDAVGIGLSGSQDVSFDRLWVHATASRGIVVQNTLGQASVRMTGSLVEQSRDIGLLIMGSEATVDGTVVRATQPRTSDQGGGRGISIQLSCTAGVCEPTTRASATVRGSLVEQNHEYGLFVAGSDALLEGTVVRANLPRTSDQGAGHGISVQDCGPSEGCDTITRAQATLRGSLVEHNHEAGLLVSGSDALVEGTVVRATLPRGYDQHRGFGISIGLACSVQGCDPATRSSAVIRDSLVEQNQALGLAVTGSDALVEGTVVRATLPRTADQTFGRGINIQLSCTAGVCDAATRADATVRGSLVELSHDVGLYVAGSDATVERTVVRATSPQASDQLGGRGINVQLSCIAGDCDPTAPASATVRNSLVEQNHDIGLVIIGSTALVEGTVVRATLPRAVDGFFGDGVAVFSEVAPASATITGALIADSARAGLASFGATVSLGSTRIQCAGYELEGEPYGEHDFLFEDLGDNVCGCPTADSACVVETAGLAPPEPAAPIE